MDQKLARVPFNNCFRSLVELRRLFTVLRFFVLAKFSLPQHRKSVAECSICFQASFQTLISFWFLCRSLTPFSFPDSQYTRHVLFFRSPWGCSTVSYLHYFDSQSIAYVSFPTGTYNHYSNILTQPAHSDCPRSARVIRG
ncbi:hypothetical protein BDQ12DRAFT_129985 [Crucibulum laeve]|uniref:Uncharacterized protein n=1 Tax=Crucibulum laeve TaxID=68775 RepID=A0A5C3LFS4_9AGAR|nr:hypothetical protein BDQ12DRAFT_129985 [Crucibulum laeve]